MELNLNFKGIIHVYETNLVGFVENPLLSLNRNFSRVYLNNHHS